MRANIVGPPSVATRIKASIAACHFLGFVLGLRKLRDVGAGILESDELAPARQRYGIFKRSFPATRGAHRPAPSSGSRNRLMVNSIFCDCRWRQLSTMVRLPICLILTACAHL